MLGEGRVDKPRLGRLLESSGFAESKERALPTGGRPALRSLALARAAPPPSVVATSPLCITMSRCADN